MATGAGDGPLANKQQQGHPGQPHFPEMLVLSAQTRPPNFCRKDSGWGLGLERPSPWLRGAVAHRPWGSQGQQLTAHLIVFVLLQIHWSQ